MGRRTRVIVPGYPHHIVQRGHNRQKIFRDEHDCRLFLELLTGYVGQYDCKLMAYCLMPNHVHMILRPPDREAIIKTLHGVGFRYARYFNQATGRTGALLENRYFSSVIAEESYLWRAAQYINLNPVRAGIVDHPCNYEWSSAKALMLCEMNGIPVENWVKKNQRLDFVDMVLDPVESASISYNLKRCLPYASAIAYTKLNKLTGRDLLQ